MPQITFTCNQRDLHIIEEIDTLANTEDRSRSGMIVVLLKAALKRRRNAKKDKAQHNTPNVGACNS